MTVTGGILGSRAASEQSCFLPSISPFLLDGGKPAPIVGGYRGAGRLLRERLSFPSSDSSVCATFFPGEVV